MITDKTAKALRILLDFAEENPHQLGIWASWFADEMWPDSPYHKVHYRCGPIGSSRGRGLILSAGSYLAKLNKRGLTLVLYREHGHQKFHAVSAAGSVALKEWAEAQDD